MPRPATKVAGSMAARPRQDVKNVNDPRGQFGAFLRHWLDRSGIKQAAFAAALGVSERTVGKWCEGSHGPAFQDLDSIADAMGYADWAALAAAVKRFSAK